MHDPWKMHITGTESGHAFVIYLRVSVSGKFLKIILIEAENLIMFYNDTEAYILLRVMCVNIQYIIHRTTQSLDIKKI